MTNTKTKSKTKKKTTKRQLHRPALLWIMVSCLTFALAFAATLFAQDQENDKSTNKDSSLHRRPNGGQNTDAQPSPSPSESPSPTPTAAPSTLPDDVSGMYAFLKEGEYLQLSIGNGEVEGVVSIYGESKSDKGEFEDLLFDTARVSGDTLEFTTKRVHGVWFAFTGTIVRGSAKKRDDEGYYLLKGTLTKHTAGSDGKVQSLQREVSFKSFPESFGKE